MKRLKLFLIVIGQILSVQSYAQIDLGFKAGVNMCNMMSDIDRDYGDEPETKIKLGFHFGLTADVPLVENTLSIQPALLFSNKGYSVDFEKMLEEEADESGVDIDDFKGHVRSNYNYIEMPVNVVFKYQSLQFFTGPYFALGIGGNFVNDFSFKADGVKMDNDDFFEEDSYKIKPVIGVVDDNDYDDYLDDDEVIDLYRALDYGFNFGIGYQVENIVFNVGYSIGLGNLTPRYDANDYDMDEDYTENVIQKHRIFNFSVSYFLNRN